jgi:hypothetical protein
VTIHDTYIKSEFQMMLGICNYSVNCWVSVHVRTPVLGRFCSRFLAVPRGRPCLLLLFRSDSGRTLQCNHRNSVLTSQTQTRNPAALKATVLQPHANYLLFSSSFHLTLRGIWSLYVPPASALKQNSVFCPDSLFVCFIKSLQWTAIVSLNGTNLLVFFYIK